MKLTKEVKEKIDNLFAQRPKEEIEYIFNKYVEQEQLRIGGVMQWVAINIQEPPFDKKILTWNENEPEEPSKTDTLVAIEHNSKGKLYKWLENGYPTHWMHLPNPPCV